MADPETTPGTESGQGGAGAVDTGDMSAEEIAAVSGTPESDSTSGTSDESGKPGDYLERIRGDSEFAVSEIRNKDRAVTNANNEKKKLHDRFVELDPFIDQLGGGKGVLGHLNRLNQLVQNAGMKKIIDRFEATGAVPTVEDYLEASETEETDPKDLKIQQLEQRINATDARIGQQDLTSYFGRLKEEFADDWDELQPQLDEQFNNWRNDPNAQKLLGSISYDALQMIAIKKLYGTPEGRAKRAVRDARKLVEARRAKATDEPSGVATTGTEKSGGPKVWNVQTAWDEFKRREGITGEIRLDR